MYTLLIVDDEKKIRTGLTQIVAWEEIGFRVAGSVENGAEALAFIEREGCPDVIMTDIRMPVVDGIGLIEQVKERGYDAAFLILSGFEYFQYAKRAIELGVFDYILKPTKLPELRGKFVKLREKLDETARTRGMLDRSAQLIRETALQDVVYRNYRDAGQLAALLREIGADGARLLLAAVVKIRLPREDLPASDLLRLCAETDAGPLRRLGFVDRLGHLVFVFWPAGGAGGAEAETEEAEAGFRADAEAALRAILDKLKRAGRQAAAGIGAASRDPDRLGDSYKQALAALQGVFFRGYGTLLAYAEPDAAGGKAEYPHELEKRLIGAIEAGDKREARKLTELLFAGPLGAERLQPAQVYDMCTEMVIVISRQCNAAHRDRLDIFDEARVGYLKLTELETLEQLKLWFRERIELMADFVLDSRDSNNSRIVVHIRKLIERKYHEQLTLHDIADSLFMNPDYLSRLFKKVTGYSFIDYLTHFRIEQAKLFLRDVSCKNYEVGFRVGYQNPSYFAKTFKKVTGRSVSEYREEHT